jgi:hypothetical protein
MITVGELIALLQGFDADKPVYCTGIGYTQGDVNKDMIIETAGAAYINYEYWPRDMIDDAEKRASKFEKYLEESLVEHKDLWERLANS